MVDCFRSKYITLSEKNLIRLVLSIFVISLPSWQLRLVKATEINFISLHESKDGSVSIKDGTIQASPDNEFKITLLGSNLNSSSISFSPKKKTKGSPCTDDRATDVHTLKSEDSSDNTAVITLNFQV